MLSVSVVIPTENMFSV